ncbi:S53 family peptidase [Paraburkholderia pallida]|uniref:Peptidase S53 n=1 Tax=Paraburkholderia pallida TaxID=2547399 RepID=A0A4P7D2T8_9BURK|nr:S53 family peptidase [Paraburkholderia pallida]QBR03121.1 peptidase S53 [Paraburkholderia pallida]
MRVFENTPRLELQSKAILAALVSVGLVACGGGNDASSVAVNNSAAPAAAPTQVLTVDAVSPEVMAAMAATPAYVQIAQPLSEPSDVDTVSPAESAQLPPAVQYLRAGVGVIRGTPTDPAIPEPANLASAQAAAAAAAAVVTYTPAQIRAAYKLPALPASWSNLTAAQQAQYGAGQTIYIVDAYSEPNVIPELAAFNQKFGLPACTTKVIAPTASLPLPAASKSGCEISVVNATAAGGMTSTVPPYDARWATEIALDVQWAHATAPLARIILIQGQDNAAGIYGAINLANVMGPGIVSMSFTSTEYATSSSWDSMFSNLTMSYVAATGDAGAEVNWPAVSQYVLGVGGTSLSLNGSTRSETVWSGTGGGISQYVATPSYQTSAVPGLGTVAHRSVADVAFNADPNTGQYTAIIPPGSSTPSWYSIGGTSLSTPQWAGILAIANAVRAQNGFGALGLAHPMLYTGISTNASLYSASFSDITSGSNGTCATCKAHTGYDQPTGLGTPNVSQLLTSVLSKSTKQAPYVSYVGLSVPAGIPASFSVYASSPDPVTFSMTNAPAGMTINASTGQITWPNPVTGSYFPKITATDTVTGLSDSKSSSVFATSPSVPVINIGTLQSKPGVALNYQVMAYSKDPVAYSLQSAPAGMSISSAGLLTWPSPVAGNYSFFVSAKDTVTGQSMTQNVIAQISANPSGPVITATPIYGTAGSAVSSNVQISTPTSGNINVFINGSPAGMTFAPSGPNTFAISWQKPVAGTSSLLIVATANNGVTSQAQLPVVIRAN